MAKRENRMQMTDQEAELGMSLRTLRPFLAIAFGLGWGLIALMILFPDQIEAVFGEISGTNPLFILAVWTPGIAGAYLVWRHHGVKGLRSYIRRVTLWRMPGKWWLFLILGIPAVKYVGAAINGTIGDFPFSPWYELLPAMAIALVIGPVEEFGWRGLAMPLLQRRFAPLWAGLILGGFWGLWHLPAFVLGGTPQSAWALGPYILGVLALSVLVTPMFNAAGGSILIGVLFHYQMNFPAWPDAQPWENYFFAFIAFVVALLNRRTMLNRGNGATEVLAAGLTAERYEESPPDEQTPVRQLGIPDHDRVRAVPSHAD
jgi:hypothetical protein